MLGRVSSSQLRDMAETVTEQHSKASQVAEKGSFATDVKKPHSMVLSNNTTAPGTWDSAKEMLNFLKNSIIQTGINQPEIFKIDPFASFNGTKTIYVTLKDNSNGKDYSLFFEIRSDMDVKAEIKTMKRQIPNA